MHGGELRAGPRLFCSVVAPAVHIDDGPRLSILCLLGTWSPEWVPTICKFEQPGGCRCSGDSFSNIATSQRVSPPWTCAILKCEFLMTSFGARNAYSWIFSGGCAGWDGHLSEPSML